MRERTSYFQLSALKVCIFALSTRVRFWVPVLALKCRRTRLKSEVFYSGKDSYPNDKRKKEGGRQTKNIWLAHKKTEEKTTEVNSLNAPCRKYVETI